MGEHGVNTNIGKAEDIIIKSGKIDAINSGKDLFFDLFCNCDGSSKFFETGIIEACGFLMGRRICAGGMLGCWARVSGELKLNASNSHVGSVGHDESKITMETTDMHGWHSACIGVNFFGEKFERSSHRGACDMRECGVRKRER